MTQKAKDGLVLFVAFLIYVFGMLVVCLVDWLFRAVLNWRSHPTDAAQCSIVLISGFVLIGYFIQWLTR